MKHQVIASQVKNVKIIISSKISSKSAFHKNIDGNMRGICCTNCGECKILCFIKLVTPVRDPCKFGPCLKSKEADNLGYGQTLFECLCNMNLPYTILDEQYHMHPDIGSLVSEGGFGEVYTALDTNKNLTVAIKAENNVDSTLLEMRVLTKFQTHTNCPKVFEAGKTRTFSYIAMQLLGKNLSQIRRSCPYVPQRMSLATTYGVLVQCLHAIEGLHDTGYIHRDIKPSNFAVGCQPEDNRVVYLFDFGLCRRYTNDDGSIKAPRPYVGFRGTVRYASLAAHEGRELSRQDDLISLFYSFVELISGNLPWRSVTEKTAVADLKRSFNFDSFCHLMPDEIDRFVKIILDVRFADRPPYDRMVQLFRRLMMRSAGGIQHQETCEIRSNVENKNLFFPPKFGRFPTEIFRTTLLKFFGSVDFG
uniref:Protein kinase domain-containing protein n=1 Tax=Romanomermis culicivorax TaxID=13658 RepID=A0A915JER4_ROMCU